MISAGEFRNGVTFEQDGQVLQVVEFQHVKPGKGAAFVRTKMKNVITGAVTAGTCAPLSVHQTLPDNGQSFHHSIPPRAEIAGEQS